MDIIKVAPLKPGNIEIIGHPVGGHLLDPKLG